MSQTFRSRDEQMADLADCLIKDGSGFHRSTLDYTAYSFIEEAEARGAAEASANVAALEARVKELETRERKDQEVIHWLAEKLKQTDPAAKADYELLARAALTREGGV